MKTTTKIEMTRKALMSVPGYSFSENKVIEICENNEYIPDGALVMTNGIEKVYFENDAFITKTNDCEIRRFTKSSMTEMQLLQLFAIWASKQI